MQGGIRNLVFEGGGILGIAYLGMLKYLDEKHILQDIKRVAGTSAGAIMACVTSFNLPYVEIERMANSLDYKKVPSAKDKIDEKQIQTPDNIKEVLLSNLIDDIDNMDHTSDIDEERSLKNPLNNIECVQRLLTKYGWYSSNYFYEWIKIQIANQFDPMKKEPPYTFADFKDQSLHKNERMFKDLYIVGTDVSKRLKNVFSYETTPHFEVAQAVRISMSIPLYFEAVKIDLETLVESQNNIFVDGGLVYNYPITIFDKPGHIARTLGGMLINNRGAQTINNLIDFIGSVIVTATDVQEQIYRSKPENMARSIPIYTGDLSPLDFNIKPGDEKYQYLFNQGYAATESYFSD